MFPNIDDKPKQNSMIKKRMDHKGETGILVIASVKTIKAKPVPSTPCREITADSKRRSTDTI